MSSYRSSKRVGLALLASAVLGLSSPAMAGLSLSPLILDFSADQAARGDVELLNNGAERLYIVVDASEILNAGTPSEKREKNPDPESLGLLATPSRLILEPGQRKFLRISMLKPAADRDRIFRVTVKPVVGDVEGKATGLKVLIGYEMLVIQRPVAPAANVTSIRAADVMILTNTGDTNAELFQGKQCDAQGQSCEPLPSQRLYAGATVNLPLKPGFTAHYAMKVQAKVVPLNLGDK